MRLLIIAIASVVLFFPAFWLFSQAVGNNWGAGIAAVAMYVALPVLMTKVWPESKTRNTDTMSDALSNGVLSSADYEVREAIEIEEFEDEGRNYLLDIGDGKTLVLTGQYLYGPVESGKFRSSRIRVFWHSTQGLTFGVECLGNKIIPSRILKPIALDESKEAFVPYDRELLDQPLARVAESIELNT